jgi:hypothetical protein
MFRHQRARRARRVVVSAAVLVLVGGGLSVAVPAHAATSVTDSFEGNPYLYWTPAMVRGSSYVEFPDFAHTRTGVTGAFLEAYPPSVHSARIHRSVTVDRPTGGAATCYASAWLWRPTFPRIKPDKSWEEMRPESPRVTLRIRSGGPSGTQLDGHTYELPAYQEAYRVANFATFAHRTGPVTVDISVISGSVMVDDVTVWCSIDPT